MLLSLVGAYPQSVSKQALLDEVWGDVVVSEASLAKLVSEARRLFKRFDPDAELVKTAHGKGYRLGVEPRLISESTAGPLSGPSESDDVMGENAESISHSDKSHGVGNTLSDKRGATSPEPDKKSSAFVWVFVLSLSLAVVLAFAGGAYFFPREKAPDSIEGRWQLIDNNVVTNTGINSDGFPYCEDNVEYMNAKLVRRDSAYFMVTPLLEINLGLDIEYGKTVWANFSYRDGHGTTRTQLELIFESPSKLLGKSKWTWEMDGTGVLCEGISTMVSER
nr:winged helix-turn-helix domain-containing protein [Pseudoteredinibacter isoporae]